MEEEEYELCFKHLLPRHQLTTFPMCDKQTLEILVHKLVGCSMNRVFVVKAVRAVYSTTMKWKPNSLLLYTSRTKPSRG